MPSPPYYQMTHSRDALCLLNNIYNRKVRNMCFHRHTEAFCLASFSLLHSCYIDRCSSRSANMLTPVLVQVFLVPLQSAGILPLIDILSTFWVPSFLELLDFETGYDRSMLFSCIPLIASFHSYRTASAGGTFAAKRAGYNAANAPTNPGRLIPSKIATVISAEMD